MDQRSHGIVFVIALACLHAAACMSSPLNGEQVGSRAQPIQFNGGWTVANQLIEIQSATARSGPFTTLTTARSARSSSLTLFAWSAVATIPNWHATSCGSYETFVRALGPRFPLVSFDDESISGEYWAACINDRVNEGNNILTAIVLCQSPQSPVVRLTTQETTFTGDVVVTTQAQADAYACYRTIDGSLTIGDSTELSIALPNLEHVSGDVHVAYPGVPTGDTFYTTRTLTLPALTRIDGDLELTIDLPGARLIMYDAGFEALTELGGSFDFRATYGTGLDLHGLNALAHIPGNLDILLNGGDFFLPGLSRLTSVGGDVTVQARNQMSVLSHVATIGGDFTLLGGTTQADSYAALQSIGGNATLQGISTDTHRRYLASLQSVAGTLDIEASSFEGAMDAAELRLGASTGLSVGALRLVANRHLADLHTAVITVEGSGPIIITDHPNLTDCEARWFVDHQRTEEGWIGIDDVARNVPCP